MTITPEQYMPKSERQFSTGNGEVTSGVAMVSGMFGSQIMADIVKDLDETNGKVTDAILWDLIVDNGIRRAKMIALYGRYCGSPEAVPIKSRKLANPNKVNNKLANDYFGDIIDTKVGYFGTGIAVDLNPDSYKSDDGDIEENAYEDDGKVIQGYRELTNAEDVESDITRMQAICGMGVKLLYVRDGETIPRQASVNPWEWIFIYDESIQEPQYAMRYYKVVVEEVSGNARQSVERWRVEWYDAQAVTYFLEDDHKHFALDANETPNPSAHMFERIPAIAVPNNKQMMGDCEKVLDLIDAVDRTDSDVNSEVEQLRLAYMYIKGAGLNLDANLVEQMKQTGVFPLGPDGDVGFITKTLDDTVITNHLKRLEQNIMRFAKSVDFGSDAFGGALPVIAYKIKIAGLEHKCKTTEMKTRAALRYEYTLLSDFWRMHGVADIDPLDIRFTFTRNLPANLEGEMNVLRQGTGLISQKTLFSLMSFIKDPEEEIRRMEEEKEADEVDLDSVEITPEEMMNAEGDVGSGETGNGGDRQGNESGRAFGARKLSPSFGEDQGSA